MEAVIDRVDAKTGRIELAAKEAARPAAALRQTMEDLMAQSDGGQVISHVMHEAHMSLLSSAPLPYWQAWPGQCYASATKVVAPIMFVILGEIFCMRFYIRPNCCDQHFKGRPDHARERAVSCC